MNKLAITALVAIDMLRVFGHPHSAYVTATVQTWYAGGGRRPVQALRHIR